MNRPSVLVSILAGPVLLGTVQCAWFSRLPPGPTVVGWQVQARWRWQDASRPPVRLRWEACRSGPTGSAVWTDDFGQSRLALVLEAERVDLLLPDPRRWWTWPNTPEGWQAVLGLPLTGGDFWDWLAGRWPSETSLRAGGAVWEDRPDPTDAGRFRRVGRWGGWAFDLTVRASDGALLEGLWVHPLGRRFRWTSTYGGGPSPTTVVGTWEGPDRVVRMVWDHLRWLPGTCRGLRLPEDPSGWMRADASSVGSPDVPLIFTWVVEP